jgi:hypothetical protein
MKSAGNKFIFILACLLIAGCAGDESEPEPDIDGPTVPILSTTFINDITQVTAESGGTISSDGGVTVKARGVCWSTDPHPVITDLISTDGAGTGNFSSFMTGLTPGVKYYLRAYAVNSAGVGYGNELSFTTVAASQPILTTTSPTAGKNSATSGGIISDDGGLTITARGVCWSTLNNPTTIDNKTTDGVGKGTFGSYIDGLSQGATYYVRAYATNSAGTSYGASFQFTTIDNIYSGAYAIITGSIVRNTATGPDPVLGGDYVNGFQMYLSPVGDNSVGITLIWKDGSGVGSIAPVTLTIDPTVTLPDSSHPVTISSTVNGTLVNSPSTENKFFPGDENTPAEFLLNFEWSAGGYSRVVTNLRLQILN